MSSSTTTTGSSSAARSTTVVPYRHICPTCGRAFQRATGLERHRRGAHSKEKTYACEFCSQAYSRIDLLQRHVSLYHKKAAADKGRMQEALDAMAQQPMIEQHSQMPTVIHNSQLVPLPHFHQADPGFGGMIGPPSGVQQQLQQQQATLLPPVNYGVDQDLLNWFNSTTPAPSEVMSDDPIMQDVSLGSGASTASTFSSSSLPWASSNFSAALPTYMASSGSGPNSASGSVMASLNASPAIDAFSSSSLGDVSTDSALNFLSPPQSIGVSSTSMDLSSISELDLWPLPQASHLDAYGHHFAHHMPFIHMPSVLDAKPVNELEADLRRAMTMIGGHYESLSTSLRQPGGDVQDLGPNLKPCDYYGCASLKAKTVRCIESMPDQPPGSRDSPVPELLRRTQTMILLQIVAMFSDVKTHRVSAKLSHGALVAIARELLQQVSFGDHDGSWAGWIRHEEIVRTLWSVYLVDSLQSFCYQRRPGLSLSELSHVPDFGPDELWLATTEAEFNERATSYSGTARESIFEFMLSLKDAAPPAPPGCLSLSGQLLVVTTLVTEIMSTVQTDTVTRRQLASRLGRILSAPEGERDVALRTLAEAVDRGDAHLRQQADLDYRHLTRWLSLLHLSGPRGSLQDKAPTPFIRDFMPWYWAGMHLLGVLRGRLAPGGVGPDQVQERLASYSAQSQDNANGPNDGSIEIMHLLVRIRLSLGVLDGGATMQCAIGSVQFAAALPALPDYLTTISIAGLFPPLL